MPMTLMTLATEPSIESTVTRSIPFIREVISSRSQSRAAVEVIIEARRPVRGALQFEGAGRLKERFRFRAGPLRRLDGDTDARVRLKLKRLVGPQHLAVVNGLKRLRHLRPPSPLGYSRLSPSA